MEKNNQNKGFVRDVIIILIAVLALNYIGFDVKKFFMSPEVKDFFFTIWEFIKNVWETYIKEPVLHVWNTVIIGIIWEWIKGFSQ